MDAPYAFNAPRCVYLAGKVHWIRSITVGDLAILSGWLDDVIPGRADRKVSPDLTTSEASEAMGSLNGRSLLAWLALRRNGFTYEQAAEIVLSASEEEWNRFQFVLFERRRTLRTVESTEDNSPPWWGPMLATIAEKYHLTFDQIGEMTFDQIDVLGNSCETESPSYTTMMDVQRMWEAARAEDQAKEAMTADDLMNGEAAP